jgi:hypothetical protein
VARPDFAQARHAHRAGGHAAPAASGSRSRAKVGDHPPPVVNRKGENGEAPGGAPTAPAHSDDARTRQPADEHGTLASPQPAFSPDKIGVNAKPKVTMPGVPQAKRATVAAPPAPVTRNAIGVAIPLHETSSGGESLGAVRQIPAALPGNVTGRVNPGVSPGINRESTHPLGSADVSNRGRSDSTSLIRPIVRPTAIGGPAKAVTGIDGTTMRTRH